MQGEIKFPNEYIDDRKVVLYILTVYTVIVFFFVYLAILNLQARAIYLYLSTHRHTHINKKTSLYSIFRISKKSRVCVCVRVLARLQIGWGYVKGSLSFDVFTSIPVFVRVRKHRALCCGCQLYSFGKAEKERESARKRAATVNHIPSAKQPTSHT